MTVRHDFPNNLRRCGFPSMLGWQANDTLADIEATREFMASVVADDNAGQMNGTAAELHADVYEIARPQYDGDQGESYVEGANVWQKKEWWSEFP